MSIYIGEECPFCHQTFKDGDDIVTCPICGTPHHRSCYEQTGHCVNKPLHKTGFTYKRQEQNNETQKTDNAGQNNVTENDENKENASPFSVNNNQSAPNSPFSFSPVNNNQNTYANVEGNIDDVSVRDATAVIVSNSARYIPLFKKNKKVNWNFSAFIFGPYFLFFRKMYKQGIIFMLVEFAASFIIQCFYSDEITAFYQSYSKIIQNGASMDNAAMASYKAMLPAIAFIAIVYLVVHIAIGMFADGFYRTFVINTVKNLDAHLDDEISLDNLVISLPENTSKSDIRLYYLSRLGGVNVFSPLFAYAALQILNYFIGMVA